MNFNVQFVYYENEIPYRCRKPRWVEKEGNIALSVREVSIEDLKPVFVVHEHDADVVVRSYSNALFKLAICNNGTGLEVANIEWLQKRISRLSTVSYGTMSYSDIVSEMEETAERYLIVGDRIYEKTGEPRYCIYTFGLGHNHGGTCLSVEYHYNENIPADRYFDALHHDLAVRTATEIATRRGDTESLPRLQSSEYIDVLNEKFVHCKPQSEHGDGNAILNDFEALVQCSTSVEEAAMLVMATATK